MTACEGVVRALRYVFDEGVKQGEDNATAWEWGSRPARSNQAAFNDALADWNPESEVLREALAALSAPREPSVGEMARKGTLSYGVNTAAALRTLLAERDAAYARGVEDAAMVARQMADSGHEFVGQDFSDALTALLPQSRQSDPTGTGGLEGVE